MKSIIVRKTRKFVIANKKKSPVWKVCNPFGNVHFVGSNLLISYSFNEHIITSITLLCMVGATPDTNKTWYN